MPPFLPGRELSARFYADAVRPLLEAAAPGLAYAAAHLGSGSDVLGFDSELSSDHGWGPAVTLVLREQDAGLAEPLAALLAERLPRSFLGYPVGFIDSPDEPGTDVPAPPDYVGPLRHRATPLTLRQLCAAELGWEPGQPLEPADWLSLPAQRLRALTQGAVHHDGPGELAALRRRLAWYPDDLWRYLLACAWRRVDQEDHLMSRAGHAGDELGSALIGGRLVRDLMALAFLIERQYAPYPKWFGTAFRQLACADAIAPALEAALAARAWPAREAAIVAAAGQLVERQNALGLAPPVDPAPGPFFSRPFTVIHAGRLVDALLAGVGDAATRALPLIGALDQWSDSTDLRSSPALRPAVRALYAEAARRP